MKASSLPHKAEAGGPRSAGQASRAESPVAEVAPYRARSDTRERLLEAAVRMFGDRGFEATTMRDLAASVGIKAPAIYNHFSSKEEILGAAVAWALRDFNLYVFGRDDPNAPPLVRLKGIVRRHVLYQLDHPALARAWDTLLSSHTFDRFGPARSRQDTRAAMRSSLETVTGLIRDLTGPDRKGTDPRLAALAVQTMCDQVIRWYRPGGRYSKARIAQSYWELAAGMIGLDPFATEMAESGEMT